MEITKVCTKCKRNLPSDKFHFFVATRNPDGLHPWCKECLGYRFTQPIPIAKHGYKICTKCGSSFPATSEYFRAEKNKKDGFRDGCKECIAKYYVRRREENRELFSMRGKIYSAKNKETLSAKKKIYNEKAENKEHATKIYKLWCQSNKEAINVKTQRRRTRKKQLPNTLTTQQWEQIKADFGYSCAYCGKIKKLTIEHFIPLSKQGELTINNVLPICLSCNCSRNNHDFAEWFYKQSFYSKQREAKIYKYLGYTKGVQQLSLM